jgi:hypothetical protein
MLIGYAGQKGDDGFLKFMLGLIGLGIASFIIYNSLTKGFGGYIADDEGRLRDPSECVRWGVMRRAASGGGRWEKAQLERDPETRAEAEEMAERIEMQSGGAYEAEVVCEEWGEYKGVPDRPREIVN